MRTRTSTAGNKGFTLLELLIVLLILGIITGLVVFSSGRIRDKMLFNEEVRKIYRTVKYARQQSLSARLDIVFYINEESQQYWLAYEDNRSSAVYPVPKEMTVKGRAIVFYPKGNSSGGQIEIYSSRGREYIIEVDPVISNPSLKRF